MSQRVKIDNGIGIYQADGSIEWFDVVVSLDDPWARRLSPEPKLIRSFTLGFVIRTEYRALNALPLATYVHELGHSVQCYFCRWPKVPNFLLNYFVLRHKLWEWQAENWIPAVLDGSSRRFVVLEETRKLLKP